MKLNIKLPEFMRLATLTDLVRDAELLVESPIKKCEFVKTTFTVQSRREDWIHLIVVGRLWIEMSREEFHARGVGVSTVPEPTPEPIKSNQIELF